jgi:octaprenyl-diphosphate synthase
MEIQDVFAAYKDDIKKVEATLDKEIISDVSLIPEVAHHLIDSGGKRFRPLLLLISAGLCGYRGDDRFSMAAVLEFIHTATLFHDDVIDQATVRRGKTSANNIWGNAASVLVGDFLYSKCFTLMTKIGNMAILELMSGITNVMSEGEVFQLMKCGDVNLTEEDYLTIIEKKTAILLSAACAAGAILGSAAPEKIDALKQFGYKIGKAFQITDDTLDYMAQEREFGKAIGKDLEEGKMTLPLIYTLKQCSAEEREKAAQLLANKETNAETTDFIFSLIQKYNGVKYSLQCAAKYISEARSQLNIFSVCPEKDQLNAVAEYVLTRRA